MRKVLARESVSRWRRRRWREVSVPLPERASAESVSDERVTLQAALAQLSPRQRAVVVLRYYEDLTEVETARALGISVGTVKSYAREALARLRDLVPGLDADDSAGALDATATIAVTPRATPVT